MSKNPWKGYTIDSPDDIDDTSTGITTRFGCLYHTSHLSDALRIVEDRKISANLVRDKSLLNETRLCVVWTSPNTWYHGSMYGNVGFKVDFDEFLLGKYMYWVEIMKAYNPDAIRLVVSESKLSVDLPRIHPRKFGYPLYCDEDEQWFRLDKYNYEIMLTQDVRIATCSRIEFFDHHQSLCNKYSSRCSDLGMEDSTAREKFVAFTVSRIDKIVAMKLFPENKERDRQGPVTYSCNALLRWICKTSAEEKEARDRDTSYHLIRSALYYYSVDEDKIATACIRAIGNEKRAVRSLLAVVKKTFGEHISERLKEYYKRIKDKDFYR